jgi:hypothetical protein
MELNPIAANMTEIRLNAGKLILFSYQTPVASWEDGKFYITADRWSNTTQRHINKWLKEFSSDRKAAEIVPQDYFTFLMGKS